MAWPLGQSESSLRIVGVGWIKVFSDELRTGLIDIGSYVKTKFLNIAHGLIHDNKITKFALIMVFDMFLRSYIRRGGKRTLNTVVFLGQLVLLTIKMGAEECSKLLNCG